MTKLEEKLLELGYEFEKTRRKSDNMVKSYIRKFEHTIICIRIGSPLYPEFDDIYVGLPGVLYKRQVVNEINMVFNTAFEHQKILKEFGLKFIKGVEDD